ncbi:MAG: hypothetical protein LBU89_13910 [Fibromonadaceae bacterium]|jgi:hypothetical protein|nr:hypothetical protein [Fibromonadaceae bacterium]
MSKTIKFATIAATLLMVAFTGCKSQNGVKLPKTLTRNDGHMEVMVKFEYDDKNRIVKMHDYHDKKLFSTGTVTYDNDGSVKIVHSYVNKAEEVWEKRYAKNANIITVRSTRSYEDPFFTDTITVNKDGYIVRRRRSGSCTDAGWTEISTFLYQNDNLIRIKEAGGYRDFIEFKYDDKKSPFYNDKTPKWLLQDLFPNTGLNNNITEHKEVGVDPDGAFVSLTTYTYEYASDGFPNKQVKSESENATITYQSGAKNSLTENTVAQNVVAEVAKGGSLAPTKIDEFTSWNVFGKYKGKFTTSSTLAPQGNIHYSAKNLESGNLQAAWCEGVDGNGIGEHINMNIEIKGKAQFTSLMVVNGYAKNQTTWNNNARVKVFRLYVDGKYWSDLHLANIIKPQIFHFPSHLKIEPEEGHQVNLTFEILEVYPGVRFEDTCITGIALDVGGS